MGRATDGKTNRKNGKMKQVLFKLDNYWVSKEQIDSTKNLLPVVVNLYKSYDETYVMYFTNEYQLKHPFWSFFNEFWSPNCYTNEGVRFEAVLTKRGICIYFDFDRETLWLRKLRRFVIDNKLDPVLYSNAERIMGENAHQRVQNFLNIGKQK